MKNLFLSAFFVLALLVNGFAVDKNKTVKKETGASYFAKNNFTSKFQGAKDVEWSEVDNYYKASFTLNGEKKSAFFDAQGEYVATTQYIKADKIPAASVAKLQKLYKGYIIGEVLHFEVDSQVSTLPYSFSSDSGNSYYFVSLRKSDTQIVVKISSSNDISYFKSL
ncbi:hypothetical protein [Desertivirga arenae]|uniref:hypothetical protein n=1 Tax=Desertivirga arenae TaxID=2810309 RepID=UPI001A95CE5D|nr:hypothetical protein [Pedobacter sp. SYSU D00823]